MAQFYTLEEAARVLGMSPEELKSKAQQREVRAFMDSGSWRIRVADVDELARRRGMGSDPDLSLSDLDLEVPASSGSEEMMLSEFQLGVANPASDTRLWHALLAALAALSATVAALLLEHACRVPDGDD